MSNVEVLVRSEKSEIVDKLDNKHEYFDNSFSAKVRRDQHRIINNQITIHEWEDYFMKEYTEKELIVNFFMSNRGSYLEFIQNINDPKKMEASALNGENPFFDDIDEVNNFYADEYSGKESSSTDHNPVINSNDIAVGTPQYKIEKRLIDNGIIHQFSVKGLQGLVEESGGYITVDSARKELDNIKKFIISESQKNYSVFKGEDVMTSKAMKIIRKELEKQGVDFAFSDVVGRRMKQNIANNQEWMAEFFAMVELAKNDPQKMTRIERKSKAFFKRMLGESLNVIIEPVKQTTILLGSLCNEDLMELK